jgi:hypothetical protein
MLADVSAVARRAAELATRRPSALRARGARFAMAMFTVTLLGAFATLVASALDPAVPFLVSVVAASALGGMIVAPFQLVSVARSLERISLDDAVARVIAGRAGSIALTGALQGAATVGAGLVVMHLAAPSLGLGLLLALGWLAAASFVHAATSVAAFELLVAEREGELHAPRVGRLALALAPGVIALAVAVSFAIAAPLPAWIDRPTGELERAPADAERVDVGTASGLAIQARGGTLEVSVADGGGCGAIDGFSSEGEVAAIPTTFRGHAGFEIGRRGSARVAFVNEDGVRLDDTIGDRLRQRASVASLGALALAMTLVTALVLTLRRAVLERVDPTVTSRRLLALASAATLAMMAAAWAIFA